MTNDTTEKLSTKQVVSYSLGDVANNLSFQMTSMFLMVYMTDIVGLSAAVAGTIYAVTKVWAGVSDLIAGSTVDKADTRWGRLRPWVLFGGLPLAAVFVMLFSTPAGLSSAGAIAWIFLLDAAFQLCYSFVNIPYGSLSAAMTQDAVDRSRLSGARSIASAVTGVALSAVVSPQFQDTAADGVRLKFTITTLLLGVLAVLLYYICFRNTREVVPRAPGKVRLKTTLQMVAKNRPLLVLCAGAFFLLGAMFTMNAVAIYYSRHVLGNAGYYTFLLLAQTIGTIGAASFVPMITTRFGKRKGYVAFAFTAVLGYSLVALVPTGAAALPVALIAWLIFGIGSGGTNALMFSMQADTVDFGEWKTGIRSEGGSYSILSFVRKCGQGLGGAVGAAVIGAFGYVAQAPSQTPEAVFGIRLATGAVPAVLGVVAALVLLRYPLTEKNHRALVGELTARRTHTGAGATAATAKGGEGRQVAETAPGSPMAPEPGRTTVMTTGEGSAKPIVTLFEQYGAGASYVGPRVAERLGVPYRAQAFSSEQIEAADEAAEREQAGWDRFVRRLELGATTDAVMASGSEQHTDHQIVLQNTGAVLDSVRDGGGVVLGRNGTVILGRVAGTLHVRLTAPVDVRIARAAADAGVDTARATKRQVREDRIRAELSARLYGWDVDDDSYYDLVVSTGTFDLDQAVDLIVQAYRAKYPQ